MPIELTLAQMPARVAVGGRTFSVEYRPADMTEAHGQFLIVVTDISAELARESIETEHRDLIAIFERILADRSGVEALFADATRTIAALTGGSVSDPAEARRLVHTLKGNALASRWSTLASAFEQIIGDRIGFIEIEQCQYDAFFDGLTTAAQVTDVSGRGFGMGALRAATEALGGELVVTSHAGEGTLVQMSFEHGHSGERVVGTLPQANVGRT